MKIQLDNKFCIDGIGLFVFLVIYILPLCINGQSNVDSLFLTGTIKRVEVLMQRNTDSAIDVCLKGITASRNGTGEFYSKTEAWLNMYLGIIYNIRGNYHNSISYYIKAEELFDSLSKCYPENDFYRQGLMITLANTATVFQQQHRYDEALRFYNKALPVIEMLELPAQKAEILNNIGIIYYNKNKPHTAYSYYIRALKNFQKLENKEGAAKCFNNLGELFLKEKLYDSAYYYLDKALAIKKDINDKFGIENSLFLLAKTSAATGKTVDAVNYAEKALDVAEELGSEQYVMDILQFLSNLYYENRRYKQAYISLARLKKISDSLFNEKNNAKLKELMTRYETKQNQLEIKALKEKELREKQVRQVLISVFVLILIIALLSIRFLLYRKRQERIMMQNELEKRELRSAELKREVVYKTRQLTTHALNMMQKNILLNALMKEVKIISEDARPEIRQALERVKRRIADGLRSEKEWEVFKLYFEELDESFFDRLRERNQYLNINDLRHAALIKLNLNIKETASVLNLSPNTIKSARNRLKKKLGLSPGDDLYGFIQKI